MEERHLWISSVYRREIYQLQIGTCHLPLQGSCAAELPHILKGIWGGEQKLFTLCWQKHWQGRSSDRYFQKPISPILVPPHI